MSRSRLVARNVVTTLVTQLVSWGLTFVVTLYLPRYLGDTGLGAITLAASFAVIFSLLVSLGTSTVLIKEIARDHSRTGELVLAALAIRIPLAAFAIGLGALATEALRYHHELQVLIWTALAAMAFGQVNDILGSALRGLEEIPRQNAAILVEKIISSVLTILLVLHRAPLWTFVAIGLVSTVFSFGINLFALWPHLRGLHIPQRPTLRSLISSGLPFLTTAVFMAVYGQSDAILLSKMSSIAAIGWYGLAKRLGGTTMMIPTALTSAMLPTLSRVYQEDKDAFEGAVRRLFNFMLICVVPFAAVLILAPGQILSLLHYPAAFRNSIPVLVMMGSAVILWYLSSAAGTALIACDRQNALSRITGISALISVPICSVLIYVTQHYFSNGAIGAMLSDVVIEAYMVTAYLRALPVGLFTWNNFGVLGRATAAALPIITLFHFVQDKRGLLLLVPGLILYIPLCWLLRCLHPQDMQMLQQIWRKRVNA
jgi:O-antigen/teichoic acid export membrane protein